MLFSNRTLENKSGQIR